jgi:hypothetical protein
VEMEDLNFTLSIDDHETGKCFKGTFSKDLVVLRPEDFEFIMKKFLGGWYIFRINPEGQTLHLTFQIIIDHCLLKDFDLYLSMCHNHDGEDSRISKLEREIKKLREEIDRLKNDYL